MAEPGAPSGLQKGFLTAPVRSRPAFALTPLADIMFQLLIFFMLTTSLAPYALVPLVRAAAPEAGAAPAAEAPAPDSAAPAVWNLGQGVVRSGGAEVPLADLPLVLAELRDSRVEEILLFITDTARTQDMVTVLEAVEDAGFARLRLMGR